MSEKAKLFRINPVAVGIVIYLIGLGIFSGKMQYPAGDTWFYSKNVLDTFTSGKLSFTEAQAAMPVFQIWLGTLICKITGGFDFWKLNVLTYIFSFLAALYTYHFIRLFTKRTAIALLGTLFLVGMPPFFKMSLVFMTDIYFYFGLVFAFYHGAKYILHDEDTGGGGNRAALLASIGFIIAILSRTNALVTYIAFLIYIIINFRSLKPKVLTWVVHLLPLLVFIIFQVWLTLTDSLPFQAWLVPRISAQNLKVALTSAAFFPFAWERIILLAKMAGYFGAIFLPLTLWIFMRSSPKWRGGDENRIEPKQARLIWLVLLPILLFTAWMLMSGDPKAIFLPGTVTEYGMSYKPDLLPGSGKVLSDDFFNISKLFFCIGGILLILAMMGRVLLGNGAVRGRGFLLAMLISTAIFPLLSGIFSDRYLIPLLPIVVIFIAGGMDVRFAVPKWVWIFPALLIIGSGLLANEYFGWTTAVWKTNPSPYCFIDQQPAADIEAGFEYTALRYYDDERFTAGVQLRIEYGQKGELLPEEEPGAYPFIDWAFPPCEYDIVVREEYGDTPYKVKQSDVEWEIVRRVEYRPFPWSKPRTIAAYARKDG